MKNSFSFISCLTLFVLFSTSLNAQLSAGDISFIAFNADGDDDFAIVALSDLPANTVIYFSDNEPLTSTTFNTGEGQLKWNTGGSIISTGTVVVFTDTDTDGNASFGSSVGTLTKPFGSAPNLAVGGDALYAVEGTDDGSSITVTTWLAGIQNASGYEGNLDSTGLVSGSTFIDFYTSGSPDGGYYSGSRSNQSSYSGYLSQIANNVNWTTETSNGENILPISTTSFTLSAGCTVPTTQATSFVASTVGDNSATISWTSGNGDSVLVIAKEGSTIGADPADGTFYQADSQFGNGDQVGTDEFVVYRGTSNSVSVTGLSDTTEYYFAIYEFTGSSTCYRSSDELTGNITTTCSTPDNPFSLSSAATSGQVEIDWYSSDCYTEFMIVAKASSTVTATPSGDGSSYTANSVFGSGTAIATDEYVVYKGTTKSATITGLTNNTTYYFKVFSRKSTSWSAGTSINDSPSDTPDDDALVLSAIYDGPLTGGYPKGIELYARKDISDLSYYALGKATNGDGSTDVESQLNSVSLSAGDYYYVSSSSTDFSTFFGFSEDETASAVSINGDDAIELFYDATKQFSGSETMVDVFGDIYTDGTGEAWEYLDGWAYRVDGTGPDGSTFVLANWTFSGTNALDGESTNSSATTPVPVGTYFWGYIYDGSSWMPSTPLGSSNGSDQMLIESGNVSMTSATEINDVTIESGATFTISSNTFTVNGNITNDGTLTVSSGASLLQTITTDGNSGSGTYNISRNTGNLVDDTRYQYWSSPVQSATMGSVFGGSNSTDFYYFDESSQSWASQASGSTMTPGRGYITTPTVSMSNSNETRTFSGDVNNGDVTLSTSGVSSSDIILVGNPYPSAISNVSFVSDNAGINGTLYFWNHTTADTGSGNDAADYATWTGLGSTGGNSTETPDDYTQSCQSFMVEASSSNPTIVFENDQRIADNNSQFFKSNTKDRVRAWLSLTNTTFDYNQLLIGFTPDASDEFDRLYDGKKYKANANLSFYSILDSTDMAIQAFQTLNYNQSKSIPLGVDAWKVSEYTIQLDTVDNWPNYYSIYLKDVLLDTVVDLAETSYSFQVDSIGIIADRFFLNVTTYPTESNGSGDLSPGVNTGISTIEEDYTTIYSANKSIKIESNSNLKSVIVYDLSGRMIVRKSTSNKTESIPVNQTGVYIIQVEKENHAVTTQKVVIQ